MARAGETPETAVEKWRRDGARLKLRAPDLINLHARGVSLPMLDALLDAQEQALRTDLDTRLARQQAEFSAQLAAEKARPGNCPNPGYWGPYPYGMYGYPGGWRGGIYRGW